MTSETGLRERKKQATRQALSETAMRLAIDEGLAAVTAERVAEQVGVSERTFRNYFAGVEEAVVGGLLARGDDLVQALRERPAEEPMWDCLLDLLPMHIGFLVGDAHQAAALAALFESSAELHAHQLAAMDEIERALAAVIAERTGVAPVHDPSPALLAASAIVTVRVAFDQWWAMSANGGDRPDLPDVVRTCLELLRAGLPGGNRTPHPTA